MARLRQAIHPHIRMVSDRRRYKEIADCQFNRIYRKRRIVKKAGANESIIPSIQHFGVSPKTSLHIKSHPRHTVYTPHIRYPKPHFKYSKVIPMIDPLIDMGFVEQATGFLNEQRAVGRKSLIRPSEKVIILFHRCDLRNPCFLGWVDHKGIIEPGETKSVQEKALDGGRKGDIPNEVCYKGLVGCQRKSGSLDLKI
jgi:hypothetical protein